MWRDGDERGCGATMGTPPSPGPSWQGRGRVFLPSAPAPRPVCPQVMKTMGLNNAVHWVAWFITGFVQLSISVTALTAILKYGQVLMHSHVLIIWLFLAVYAVATIMFWCALWLAAGGEGGLWVCC